MNDPVDPAATSRYGNYRVLRSLARGGMGRLSVAEDGLLHRKVVLKEILEPLAKNPSSRRRFVTEAQITGQLEHPGIVPVYALGMDRDGRPFYTMRRVRGETLKTAIADYHQKPSLAGLRELLRRFIAVCQTVAYAHARGVIHRDLKPSNVMLGGFGETLVLDWGLAKPVTAGASSESTEGDLAHEHMAERLTLTEPGARVGTAAYMAPEQAEGRSGELGPAADVYGLGSILYQLLVGKPPYSGKSSDEILEKVRSTAPQKPSEARRDISRPLEAICLRAMARRPEARYPDATALAADVQNWLDDEPVSEYPEPRLQRAWRWSRHHKTATVSGLVCLFSVVLVGAVAAVFVARERARTQAALEQAAAAIARANEKEKEAERLAKQAEEAGGQAVKAVEAAMAAADEANAKRTEIDQLEADLQAKPDQADQLRDDARITSPFWYNAPRARSLGALGWMGMQSE